MKRPLFLLAAIIAVALCEPVCDPIPGTPPNAPLGKCRGIKPGRVTWAWEPSACTWNGDPTTRWWNDTNFDAKTVSALLDRTLVALTGGTTVSQSWRALFDDVNSRVYGQPKRGYRRGDGLAVKVNLNGMFASYDDNNANGLSPQFLRAVLASLVSVAGVPQEDIAVYDASRWFVDYQYAACHSLFPRIRYVDNAGQKGREKVVVDQGSHLQYSSRSVPAWNDTWLPTVVTKARFMLIVDNFRGHSFTGVTLTGKNYFGTIYRPDCECGEAGHWCPKSLHSFVNVHDVEGLPGNPMASYTPLVDFLGHPDLAGKAIAFLMDGLLGGTQQNRDPPIRFASEPFNGGWSCSIFGSQDPVALDSVAYDFLRNEPNVPFAHNGCVDNYLHEAALVPNPPSGTAYDPTGHKPLAESLGCHEHWDSAKTKRYSRNLGTGNGIELFRA